MATSNAANMSVDKENENVVVQDKKRDNVLIIVGDDNNIGSESGKESLQSSFKKFREQKIREHQMMKMCRENVLKDGRTPEFKEALRQKFIDGAKKYLGVPYHIRYKAEEDPVAPLYLDCCGLVRKVVQDLQDDFGFVIGKWNQAYQMDTLPIVLKEEELKPGDLIFYEGKYCSDRSKPQKHDNVHVEIFLGGETGEATIASRYHRGRVSIFPSYKFPSTCWSVEKFHFRSLDTWLSGECTSHCSEHPWQSDSLNYVEAAGKRSIFSAEHELEEEDVSAGGLEDEELDTSCEVEHNNDAVACTASAEVNAAAVEGAGDGIVEMEAESSRSADAAAVIAESSNGTEAVGQSSKKNVGRRATVPAKSPLGSSKANAAASDTHQQASGKTRPKRLSAFSSNSGSQKQMSSSTKSVSDVDPTSMKANQSKTYYVNKTNGWKLVKNSMDKRGWTQLPFDYQFSNRFGLKWVERRISIDYVAHTAGQLVCHIPNNDIVTTKIGLLSTLRDKYCRMAPGAATRPPLPWLPATFDLENPADCRSLIAEEQKIMDGNLAAGGSSAGGIAGGYWIYKPSCKNRGRGIRVVSGMDMLKELCFGKPMGGGSSTTNGVENAPSSSSAGAASSATGASANGSQMTLPYKGIVQKYLTSPLLVSGADPGSGCKFDIRCYLLIARTFPTTLAFYCPGYCRLALKPYSLDDIDDSCAHLTNASVQKKDNPSYASYKSIQVQSMEAIAQDLEQRGRQDSADYVRNGQLDNQIKTCLVDVLKASNGVFLKKHGYFDLLGCDFMITDENKLFLLEMNTNPALTLDNETLAELLPKVVDGCIELVLQSQGPERRITDADPNFKDSSKLPEGYELIFDEGTGYMFKQKIKRRRKASKSKAPAATAGTIAVQDNNTGEGGSTEAVNGIGQESDQPADEAETADDGCGEDTDMDTSLITVGTDGASSVGPDDRTLGIAREE